MLYRIIWDDRLDSFEYEPTLEDVESNIVNTIRSEFKYGTSDINVRVQIVGQVTKKPKKIRINPLELFGNRYDLNKITITPIMFKSCFTCKGKHLYEKRLAIRFPNSGIVYSRFRGKVPLHKVFTANEFCNCFYMIMDEQTNTPYFKYYKKSK